MLADRRFQSWFLYRVHFYPDKLTEVVSQFDKLKKRQGSIIKLNQNIKITAPMLFPPYVRAEDTERTHTVTLFEFGQMPSENRDITIQSAVSGFLMAGLLIAFFFPRGGQTKVRNGSILLRRFH